MPNLHHEIGSVLLRSVRSTKQTNITSGEIDGHQFNDMLPIIFSDIRRTDVSGMQHHVFPPGLVVVVVDEDN